MSSFISFLVNNKQWEIRRFSGEYYHRRPGHSVWTPGIPPDASVEEIDTAFARLELRPGKKPLRDTDDDEGKLR